MSIAEHRMNQDLTLINPVTSAQSVWKRAFWWIQVLVTCALVFALCQMCRWDRMANVWTSGDPRLWLVSVIFLNLCLLAGGVALLVLIRPNGRKFSGIRFLLDYAHVQFLCQVTPGQIGELMLPYMHGSATIPPGTTAAGLLLQRIVAMLIVAVTAVCFASSRISSEYVIAQSGFVILGCIAMTSLISHGGARARFNAIVGHRYGPILNGFYGSWLEMTRENRMRRMLPHVSLMALRFAMSVLGSYFIFLSLGVSVPLAALTGVLAIATLATAIPISLNGLGIVESVTVLSLRHYGPEAEEILSACVLGRGLMMLVLLSWSFLFWIVRWNEQRASQAAG
jgi:uncharacterized protein (TIRG00374 family)